MVSDVSGAPPHPPPKPPPDFRFRLRLAMDLRDETTGALRAEECRGAEISACSVARVKGAGCAGGGAEQRRAGGGPHPFSIADC